MGDTFDFIVVGGGTAGCLLASRLADAQTRPLVLLIEAGDDPEETEFHSIYDRYVPALTRPDLDHGYLTTPQSQLNNRELPYLRGKAMGGTSNLNFMAFVYGSAEDYNRWGELVGDGSWSWKHTKEDFKKIETYDTTASAAYSNYVNPKADDHGHNGLLKLSLPRALERGIDLVIDAGEGFGYPRNVDLNSGDPIGMGIFPNSYANGRRTTSATAHLANLPENLIVWKNSWVSKLLFEGKLATGVELRDGRQALAEKEVILCAGAIDSPKILLLSGVGKAAELEAHGIKVVHELPGVGKNLQDHILAPMIAQVDGALSDTHTFENDPEGIIRAREVWLKDGSGPLSHHHGSLLVGFLKLPALLESEEFKALDAETREYLSRPSVPLFEMVVGGPMLPPVVSTAVDKAYLSWIAILLNAQSRGEVTLRSVDPNDAPVINPKHLEHPYDRKALLESIRETMRFQQHSALGKYLKEYVQGPKSTSDEDILAFMKESAGTVYHPQGTVVMGRPDDTNACVGSDFVVFGLNNLRVADLSIAPTNVNNHPQSTAYLIGHKAAEAIIKDRSL